MPKRSWSSDDEVVVQVVTVRALHDERQDRQPFGMDVAEHLNCRVCRPRGNCSLPVRLFVSLDRLDAHGLLQLEHQPGTDRFDDRRRPAFLAIHRVVECRCSVGLTYRDGSSTRPRRAPGCAAATTVPRHAGRAWAADELVADEHSVFVRQWMLDHIAGTSRCRHMGQRRRNPQNDSAPKRWRRSAIAHVLDTMPVTLDAAENEPILTGRSP